MSRFNRFLTVVLIAIAAVFSLGACSSEEPHDVGRIHSMDHHQQADAEPTTIPEAAEAHARSAAKAVGYSLAWVFNAFGIAVLPLLALLIPGSLFGSPKTEKVSEGVVMLAGGIFFMWMTFDADLSALPWWALAVDVLPGAFLLVWGLVSGSEEGKLLLLVPFGAFIFWMLAQIWTMFTLGLVHQPIITIGLIILKLFLFALIFGGEERSSARA